jgi:hypothetical protein
MFFDWHSVAELSKESLITKQWHIILICWDKKVKIGPKDTKLSKGQFLLRF